MLKVMEGLPQDVFGVEADAFFDEEDQKRILLLFEACKNKRQIRKLLLCFTDMAEQSEYAYANRYANWTNMLTVEVAALVGPEKWHDKFRILTSAVRAKNKIFTPDQRKDAIDWLADN